MKAWPTFKLRLYAWWEGYDAEELLARYEEKTFQPGSSAKAEDDKTISIPALAPWESPRIRIMQLIWGAGCFT